MTIGDLHTVAMQISERNGDIVDRIQLGMSPAVSDTKKLLEPLRSGTTTPC